MKFINGINRNQMQFFALEELVAADSDVRLIDAFVNGLDLAECGFKMDFGRCRVDFLRLQLAKNLQYP